MTRKLMLMLSMLCVLVAGCCLLSRESDNHLWSFDDEMTDENPIPSKDEPKGDD